MLLQSHLIDNCIALLEQARDLLWHIDDDLYSQTNLLSPRGSIGGHLRHCLDFYQSFISGVPKGRIDYNLRRQDPRIEEDRGYARKKIDEAIGPLRTLSSLSLNGILLVSTEDSGQSLPSWCTSSIGRELEFLQSHLIHHYSLIAILVRLQGIEPGAHFGVAPSTMQHWRELSVCAQ